MRAGLTGGRPCRCARRVTDNEEAEHPRAEVPVATILGMPDRMAPGNARRWLDRNRTGIAQSGDDPCATANTGRGHRRIRFTARAPGPIRHPVIPAASSHHPKRNGPLPSVARLMCKQSSSFRGAAAPVEREQDARPPGLTARRRRPSQPPFQGLPVVREQLKALGRLHG